MTNVEKVLKRREKWDLITKLDRINIFIQTIGQFLISKVYAVNLFSKPAKYYTRSDEELKVDFTDFKIKVQRKSLLLN